MNHGRKKWSLMLLSLTLAVGLAACSKNNEPDAAASPSASASASPSASPSESGSAEPSASPAASASASPAETASVLPADQATLPDTKTFTLNLEGNEEKRTAKLAKGQGYALYVFDGFTLDADASKLVMDGDKKYYVEITKLPSDFNTDQLKKDSEKELSKLGEVRELKGEEKSPLIGDTTFFLLANDDKLTNEIILKEVAGTGYLLKVNMPHTEANEGFGPHAFLSLSSIANQ